MLNSTLKKKYLRTLEKKINSALSFGPNQRTLNCFFKVRYECRPTFFFTSLHLMHFENNNLF